MVCGDKTDDVRVPHKGKVVDEVIEGAIRVLDSFELADAQREGMKDVQLNDEPPRIWWRLQLLRKWSHEQVEQIFC